MNTGYRYFIFLNSKDSGFNTKKGLYDFFWKKIFELFLYGRIKIYPIPVSGAPLGDPEDHKTAHLLVVDSTYVPSFKKALHVCPIHGCEYGSLLEYGEKEGKEFEKKLRESLLTESKTRKNSFQKYHNYLGIDPRHLSEWLQEVAPRRLFENEDSTFI